jgi:hypothetical protein
MSDSAATPADFELGRLALLEITPAKTIGEPAGSIDEGDGVVSVYFESTMAGYPGWRWTVSIAHVDGAEPTVMETELTPGENALLSPDWVPWADRLADYKASQAELADGAIDGDDAGDDDEDAEDLDDIDDDEDDDTDDDDDFDDDDGVALLHSGDLDGVDIDELEDELEGADDEDADDSASEVGVDEPDEPEHEADDASPEPPVVARGKQRGKKQEDS